MPLEWWSWIAATATLMWYRKRSHRKGSKMPAVDEFKERLELLPVSFAMKEALERYVMRGIEPGGFLTALLSNDLWQTVARADDQNARVIKEYTVFLYNWAPSGCWGSSAKFEAWIERGGMLGPINYETEQEAET
jgi:hypothetical protein